MKTLIGLLFFLTVMTRFGFSETNIKEPNVSGQFYSANPDQLSKEIEGHLNKAAVPAIDEHIEVLIAPHAGYVYSGPVAGYGFKAVQAKKYNTIIILAPSHYYPFEGVSIWTEGGFKTPLGIAPVDTEFAKNLLAANPKFSFTPSVFEREHSLEVEIPFLQKIYTDFKIVPVIMGQPKLDLVEQLAKKLNELIGERKDVLIVVSSDMSHYHPDAEARQMDQATIATIEKLDAGRLWTLCTLRKLEMCGFVPVTTALFYAKERGLAVKTLRYANSSDVTGDRDRVVGYTAIVMSAPGQKQNSAGEYRPGAPLTKEQKKYLLDIAWQTVKLYVETGKTLETKSNDPRLNEPEGAFVTVHKSGRLRGCIGHVIGDKPLIETVRDMAIAAVSQDPRFDRVTAPELPELDVEISVLSQPRISNVNEIEMGKHGVILRQGPMHQGLFLPQVATETGWSKEEFLAQLCSQKAGLPRDCWKDPQTRIHIFTADVFAQKDVE
jgi:MEMO1 family protein